jgi:hypothetical protein
MVPDSSSVIATIRDVRRGTVDARTPLMRTAMFLVLAACTTSPPNTSTGHLATVQTMAGPCVRPDVPCGRIITFLDGFDDVAPQGYGRWVTAFAVYPDQTSVPTALGWSGDAFELDVDNQIAQIPLDTVGCGSGPREADWARVITVVFDSGGHADFEYFLNGSPVDALDGAVNRFIDAMDTCTKTDDVALSMCIPADVDPLTHLGRSDQLHH